MDIVYLSPPYLPPTVVNYLGQPTPERLAALGNIDLLNSIISSSPLLALFCSVKCPGNLILQTYDLAQNLRKAGMPVGSGFHSPLEKECLTILLRGKSPLLICPARSLAGMRFPAEWQEPLSQGRLLLLSPFATDKRRPTADMAQERNRFVAALASHIFIAYAAPGGKTEQFCREVLSWGKPVYTFTHEANAHLAELGVRAVGPGELVKAIQVGQAV